MQFNFLKIVSMDINILKDYFENRENVAFAYLFGSQAQGRATKLSDIDIAVYFTPEKWHPIEYEEEIFYLGEDEIWSDLEKLLKKDIELLVLNRVSATISASAIRGIPLAINDWGLYLDFMLTVTREAEDFRETVFNNFLERRALERNTQTDEEKS